MATGVYIPTIMGMFFEISIIVLFLWPSREKIFQLKKCHINHFKIYNSVASIGSTVLCNQYVCFHTFPSPRTEALYLLSNTPHSRNPHNLVTSKLLFVSVNLPILGTLYKWNHAVLVFWFWLISLSLVFPSFSCVVIIYLIACIRTPFLFRAE